jgi:hypothetical protein
MSRKHRKYRKPFDWLTVYKGRRGTLALIRRGIREGWMDNIEQADRREQERQSEQDFGHLSPLLGYLSR